MAQIVGGKVKLDNGTTITPQQGGWYDGQQYWGGTLSAKGQINSLSDQPGAGQKVSAEVNRQSDAAQGLAPGTIQAYVDKPANSITGSGFSDKSQVQSYLNGVQNSVYQTSTAGVPGVRSTADIAAEIKGLLPTGQAPQAPNMLETYKQMRADAGVETLETSLNDLTKQIREQEALKTKATNTEIGKPVAMDVISGRVSEVERAQNERIDALNRQRAYLSDTLKTAYSNIDLIMKYTAVDYDNAKQAYDSQFTQTMQILTMAHGIQQDEISLQQHQQDVAMAQAQIMMNNLKEGSIDIKSDPALSAQLNGLEVKAGLPIGFFTSIKKDPKADIVSTTSNEGQIQVLLRNPDGTMSLQTYGTKNSSSGKATAADKESYYKNAAIQDASGYATLKDMIKIYTGILSPNDIYTIYNANSPYGPAKESKEELSKYGITFAQPASQF